MIVVGFGWLLPGFGDGAELQTSYQQAFVKEVISWCLHELIFIVRGFAAKRMSSGLVKFFLGVRLNFSQALFIGAGLMIALESMTHLA